MSIAFDWNRSNPDVAFPAIGALAIYCNESGDIVIRQQRPSPAIGDEVIVIPRVYGDVFMRRFNASMQEA